MDIPTLAAAVTNHLGPFLPYLLAAGKTAGKKLEEVVIDQVSEGLWNQARQLWVRLTARLGDDAEVSDAAGLLATAPGSTLRAQVLTEVLTQRLQGEPQLAAELVELLGGSERAQRVAAGTDAELSRISQEMTGAGTQEVSGGERARISDVSQVMK